MVFFFGNQIDCFDYIALNSSLDSKTKFQIRFLSKIVNNDSEAKKIAKMKKGFQLRTFTVKLPRIKQSDMDKLNGNKNKHCNDNLKFQNIQYISIFDR